MVVTVGEVEEATTTIEAGGVEVSMLVVAGEEVIMLVVAGEGMFMLVVTGVEVMMRVMGEVFEEVPVAGLKRLSEGHVEVEEEEIGEEEEVKEMVAEMVCRIIVKRL